MDQMLKLNSLDDIKYYTFQMFVHGKLDAMTSRDL
jgi:hypothetical protein